MRCGVHPSLSCFLIFRHNRVHQDLDDFLDVLIKLSLLSHFDVFDELLPIALINLPQSAHICAEDKQKVMLVLLAVRPAELNDHHYDYYCEEELDHL